VVKKYGVWKEEVIDKECEHDWKYTESGYNPNCLYCHFYVCKKCGATAADIVGD
jgi:hypothetical protein